LEARREWHERIRKGELFAVIVAGEAVRLEGFFADAERRIGDLPEGRRAFLVERLAHARQVAGSVNFLDLESRRTPDGQPCFLKPPILSEPLIAGKQRRGLLPASATSGVSLNATETAPRRHLHSIVSLWWLSSTASRDRDGQEVIFCAWIAAELPSA
jgi:hypothetical protein